MCIVTKSLQFLYHAAPCDEKSMQVEGECSNHSDIESEESPVCMQVVAGGESSNSSDTDSEEERTDSEDVHNGNKDKDMGKHANVERKTAVKPVVRTTSPILMWLCSVLIWISLKIQMTNRAISAICGLILRLTENPLSQFHIWKSTSSAQIQSTKYVACPDDACNQLYTLAEAQACKTFTSKKFGKICCYELGYTNKMAFGKIPHKLYHFVAPSVWLTHV